MNKPKYSPELVSMIEVYRVFGKDCTEIVKIATSLQEKRQKELNGIAVEMCELSFPKPVGDVQYSILHLRRRAVV